MRKVAVVSALFLIDFNEIDTPSSNFVKCEEFEYFMFTNDKSKIQNLSNEWNIIEIDSFGIKNGVYLTKRVKWLTHEYLPDYDIIIWVDSFIVPNYLKLDDINAIIDVCLDDKTSIPIFMRTQKFKSIQDDIDWCIKNDRINEEMTKKIINYIENTELFSVNKEIQTYWSSAIIKNNKNIDLINMSIELYNYITKICYRDQHILPVLLNKFNINCNIIKSKIVPTDTDIFINKGQQNRNNHKYIEKIIY